MMKTETIGFYIFERDENEREEGPQVFDLYEDAMRANLPAGKLYWVNAVAFDEEEVAEVIA